MNPNIESASQISSTLQAGSSLTLEDWHKQYWFDPMTMVTVVNPLSEDWRFMVELRSYVIEAGKHKDFPGMVANVYLDQMSKILAQNEDKLGYMGDPNLRKVYYDKLIVHVNNLVEQTDNTPAYLRPTSAAETPPWQQNSIQSSTPEPVAPTAPQQPPAPEPIAEA